MDNEYYVRMSDGSFVPYYFLNATSNNKFQDLEGSQVFYNPEEGFRKGNMNKDSYNQYKNVVPKMVEPRVEKERLLLNVQIYYHACNDIVLYLDNFPNDLMAINLFNSYRSQLLKAIDIYQAKYGPLDIKNISENASEWEWTKGCWPWMGGK